MTDVNAKKTSDWPISSQASWGQEEGSTPSAGSPGRTVKRHECGACGNKRTKPVYNFGLGSEFERLVELAAAGFSSRQIASQLGAKTKTVTRYCSRHGIALSRPQPKPKKADTYHKGFITTHNGYRMVSAPDHPHADSKGYVREHRLIMEKRVGHVIPKEFAVHHINGIKDDNRVENLEIVDRRVHASLHAKNGDTGWARYHSAR